MQMRHSLWESWSDTKIHTRPEIENGNNEAINKHTTEVSAGRGGSCERARGEGLLLEPRPTCALFSREESVLRKYRTPWLNFMSHTTDIRTQQHTLHIQRTQNIMCSTIQYVRMCTHSHTLYACMHIHTCTYSVCTVRTKLCAVIGTCMFPIDVTCGLATAWSPWR